MTNADRDGGEKDRLARVAHVGTVVPFRPRTSNLTEIRPADPVEGAAEADDFRHRMFVNAAGLACAAVLIASGIWLASSIADLRNTQDCVLSGRRNCAPVAAVDKAASATAQH